jgi:DNA-binding MarR family transcriptional regulator
MGADAIRRRAANAPSATRAPKPRLEPVDGGAGHDAPDDVLHHRLRLGIASALAGAGSLTFVELRDLLQTSDGNLSVHARRLEEAGLLTCAKSFADRRPRSDYRLTAAGQRSLRRYLDHMEALIAAARSALKR